ncbi:MAG: hypothetical protein MR800_00255 [Collinsella sp.]|nr:hypothetical protein [Collinsella sp.]MDY4863851.1 hypothetical protein [Collinsella sp.]
MKYLDWLFPLALAICILAGAVKIAPRIETNGALSRRFLELKRWIVANYLLVIVACMIVCPLFVQVIYSIPLCHPAVSSESVLGFWGVSLGIIGGALLFLKQKEIESLDRLNSLRPKISIQMSRDGEDAYLVRLTNKNGYKYSIFDICGIAQFFTLDGFDEKYVQIDKRQFEAFNDSHKNKLVQSGRDVSKIPKFVSIRLSDLDGTLWTVNYRYQFKEREWIEGSYFCEKGSALR